MDTKTYVLVLVAIFSVIGFALVGIGMPLPPADLFTGLWTLGESNTRVSAAVLRWMVVLYGPLVGMIFLLLARLRGQKRQQ